MKMKFGFIVTLFVSMFILSSCDYSVGEEVEIRTDCFGCYDQETFSKSVQYANQGNGLAFRELVTSSNTTVLRKGSRGRVVKVNKISIILDMSTDYYRNKYNTHIWVMKRNVRTPRKKHY